MPNGSALWCGTNWRLQIYQHIRPAAFRCLQGFNELKEKLFIQYIEWTSHRFCASPPTCAPCARHWVPKYNTDGWSEFQGQENTELLAHCFCWSLRHRKSRANSVATHFHTICKCNFSFIALGEELSLHDCVCFCIKHQVNRGKMVYMGTCKYRKRTVREGMRWKSRERMWEGMNRKRGQGKLK